MAVARGCLEVDRRLELEAPRRPAGGGRMQALGFVRARYADFGPMFAHQKFTEDHLLPIVIVVVVGDFALRQLGS